MWHLFPMLLLAGLALPLVAPFFRQCVRYITDELKWARIRKRIERV